MCLEFLCNWRHHDEEELHRGSPNYSSEHKNTNYYPTKDDPPSKPTVTNGKDGRKGDTDYNYAYGTRDAYGAGDEPLKPPRGQFNGTVGEHDKYPARDGSPPKPHREPYNGTESGPKGGKQLPSGVVVNGDHTNVKAVHPKTSSMPVNGENPNTPQTRSNDSVPYAGNNTALTTPVQQPNHRTGADSSVFHGNGHYHAVDDSGQRNRNMQNEEEEDEGEGGGRVPTVAELKNRWYF